jgi:hypothetical protein
MGAMPSSGFFFPFLAHGEGSVMSFGEILLSVSLLVISAGIAAAMLLMVFLKPLQRVRRQWKEGRLPQSNKLAYLFLSVLVILGFLTVVWRFGWATYYDMKFHEYEEKMEASGKHPKAGAEYKWERWHINGKYTGGQLMLLIDDVVGSEDPGAKITASVRVVDPKTTEWQPMTWDAKQRAFVAKISPEGNKMTIEFDLRSGWSSYTDQVIGYVPRNIMQGHENLPVVD